MKNSLSKAFLRRLVAVFGLFLLASLVAMPAGADTMFTFTEVGGDVTMTSSGTLDTTNLVLSNLSDGWGGTGIEQNSTPGDIDIMGGTSFGPIDILFGFNAGTDYSAITNPGGPFSISDFGVDVITGSRSFSTYSGFSGGFRQAGIGMSSADIVGGLWTPDQNWTWISESFASLGLNIGTFSVSDFLTGETITIQVGGVPGLVPEPSSMLLLGVGLIGLAGIARRKQKK